VCSHYSTYSTIITPSSYYEILDDQFPPRAQTLEQREESNFSDGSGPLFSMYLDRAEEEDKKMAESWKGDADGILVFVSPHFLPPTLSFLK
jgi:hypothetical protein